MEEEKEIPDKINIGKDGASSRVTPAIGHS
jgi:hypothetical protein